VSPWVKISAESSTSDQAGYRFALLVLHISRGKRETPPPARTFIDPSYNQKNIKYPESIFPSTPQTREGGKLEI